MIMLMNIIGLSLIAYSSTHIGVALYREYKNSDDDVDDDIIKKPRKRYR